MLCHIYGFTEKTYVILKFKQQVLTLLHDETGLKSEWSLQQIQSLLVSINPLSETVCPYSDKKTHAFVSL
jgi:hypothetical protein